MPNATTSARRRVGPGDERQDRHELGVDGQQGHRRARPPRAPGSPAPGRPGPTRSRPRVEAKRSAAPRRRCTPRSAARRGSGRTGERSRPARRPSRRRPRPARLERRAMTASTSPSARLLMASDHDDRRRADGRDQHERARRRLPTIAPAVFTASSEPDSPPAEPASSRSRIEAVGKAIPSTIVTGRTTQTAEPKSALSVAIGFAGVERLRPAEHEHQPEQRQAGDERPGSARAAAADRRAAAGSPPKISAPMRDPDQERRQDRS